MHHNRCVTVPPEPAASAHRLRELAQGGLAYTRDAYDRERFEEIAAIAHGLLARATGLPPDVVQATFGLERGYPTPKLDVRAAVLDAGGRLLLVRDAELASWSLPGGWADIGSSPSEAAVREVAEEAGVEVVCERLAALLDKRRGDGSHWAHHIFTSYFLCRHVCGEPQPDGLEVTEAAFFDVDDLPQLSPRSPNEHVRIVLQRAADPLLPAAFD